jgi:hypothetical protein
MGRVRMAYGAMAEQFAVLVKPDVGSVCAPEGDGRMKRRRCGSVEHDRHVGSQLAPRVVGLVAVCGPAVAVLLLAGCAAKHSSPSAVTGAKTSPTSPASSAVTTTEDTVSRLGATTVPTPTTALLATRSGPVSIRLDDALRGTVRDVRPALLLDPSIESFRPGSQLTLLAAGSSLRVQLDDQDLPVQLGRAATVARSSNSLHRCLTVSTGSRSKRKPQRSVVGHILQGAATLVEASVPQQMESSTLPGDVSLFLPKEADQGYFDELFDLIDGEDGIGIYNRVTRVARFVRSDGSLLPGPAELPMDFTPLGYNHGSVVGYRSDGTMRVVGPDGGESPSTTPGVDLDVQRLAGLVGGGQVYDYETAGQLLLSPFDGLWYQFEPGSGAIRLSMQSSHMFLPFGTGGTVEFQRPDGIARRIKIPNESRLSVVDRACSPTTPGHCVALIQGVAPTLTAVGITPDGQLGFLGTVSAVPTYLLSRRSIAFQGGRAVAVVPSGDHVRITALE